MKYPEILPFLDRNAAIQGIVLTTLDFEQIEFFSADSAIQLDQEYTRKTLGKNDKLLKRLVTYEEGGFQKVETLDFTYQGSQLMLLLFVLKRTIGPHSDLWDRRGPQHLYNRIPGTQDATNFPG